MKNRIFITFEGGEGSGKSTSIRYAITYLRKQGKKVFFVRDPGTTKIGEAIRDVLLDPKNRKMSVATELFLYLAARAQMVDELIRPALQKGNIVISDRFEDSTVAYQWYAGNVGAYCNTPLRQKIFQIARGNIVPNLTFLLDVAVREGLRRSGRKDRMEHKSIGFHEKIRRGYLALARKNPKRYVIISTKRPKDEVKKQIEAVLKHVFSGID